MSIGAGRRVLLHVGSRSFQALRICCKLYVLLQEVHVIVA
jgi:hypothetical protein